MLWFVATFSKALGFCSVVFVGCGFSWAVFGCAWLFWGFFLDRYVLSGRFWVVYVDLGQVSASGCIGLFEASYVVSSCFMFF